MPERMKSLRRRRLPNAFCCVDLPANSADHGGAARAGFRTFGARPLCVAAITILSRDLGIDAHVGCPLSEAHRKTFARSELYRF